MVRLCKHSRTKVINSRVSASGLRIRRHKCWKCDHRFSTVEIPVSGDLREADTEIYLEFIASFTPHQCRSILEQVAAGHKSVNLI